MQHPTACKRPFSPGCVAHTDYCCVPGSYCFYNRFEDCSFTGSAIGIHSGCNNLRVAGTNIDSCDISGILIDGGGAIDIVGNLIEGNAGPAIILSAGLFGAPMGVTIESNYCG